MVDTQRTYIFPGHVAVPAPDRVSAGLSVGPAVTEVRRARYYDTADWRLRRAGAALELWQEGSAAGWHLRLPAGSDRRDLEVSVACDPTPDALTDDAPAVPEGLSDLTAARTVGAPLRPVAALVIHRTRTPLTDRRGRAVAELAVDDVEAAFPDVGRPPRAWQELDLQGRGGGREKLHRLDRAIRGVGGARAPFGSKLAHALGAEDPTRPAAARPAPDDPVAPLLAVRWRALVDELVARDPEVRRSDPEGVHKMRVATRRLRSLLGSFAPLLEPSAVGPLRRELRWLGAGLGGWRDAEVLAASLTEDLDRLEPSEVLGPARDDVLGHLAAQRRDAATTALAALRSARYLELLEALLAFDPGAAGGGHAGRSTSAAAATVMRRELRRVRRRVRSADRARRPQERARAYHEVRKAAKSARYAAETFEPALGAPARRLARRFEDLQELLGAAQDAAVARRVARVIGVRTGVLPGHNGFTMGLLSGLQQTRIDTAHRQFAAHWRAVEHDRAWTHLGR